MFYIRTNSGGRTFRLVEVPVKNPARRLWREVIANRPGVMLGGADAFAKHLVLFEREGGLPYLRIVDLQNRPGTVEEHGANYLEEVAPH